MRIFLTGATGFIGTTIVPELVQAGHQVLGLTRSDAGAKALQAAGADVHRGNLEDLESLRDGASKADAVIHTAFDHDFSNFAANCEKDHRAILALGEALKGSKRTLLITSGTGLGDAGDGNPATEDVFNAGYPNPRKLSELAGTELLNAGVNVSVMRLPQVHDTVKQGLITFLVAIAREKGLVGYAGEGANCYPAAHVSDVARLYRLAIEKQQPGARYNAVAEEGVRVSQIAEALGRGLKLPVRSLSPDEAGDYFGWMIMFAAMDMRASGTKTKQLLDWHPSGPSLLTDLGNMNYNA